MTTTTYPPTTHHALMEGLNWLYRTVQPDTALVEHCGARLRTAARTLRFLPVAHAGNPLVVIEVDVHRGLGRVTGPAAVISDSEILDVAAELAAHKLPAVARQNHGLTATLGLSEPAHESLRAAVARFSAGCPYHHSLVCEAPVSAGGAACPWHTHGHRAAIWPADQQPDTDGVALP